MRDWNQRGHVQKQVPRLQVLFRPPPPEEEILGLISHQISTLCSSLDRWGGWVGVCVCHSFSPISQLLP